MGIDDALKVASSIGIGHVVTEEDLDAIRSLASHAGHLSDMMESIRLVVTEKGEK